MTLASNTSKIYPSNWGLNLSNSGCTAFFVRYRITKMAFQ